MTIDYREWSKMWKDMQNNSALLPPEPQYRMVEQSAAWQQLTSWLRERVEVKEKELEDLVLDLQLDGDYSHDALIKKKVRIDICQAEVLTLGNIEAKVLTYTQEGD